MVVETVRDDSKVRAAFRALTNPAISLNDSCSQANAGIVYRGYNRLAPDIKNTHPDDGKIIVTSGGAVLPCHQNDGSETIMNVLYRDALVIPAVKRNDEGNLVIIIPYLGDEEFRDMLEDALRHGTITEADYKKKLLELDEGKRDKKSL